MSALFLKGVWQQPRMKPFPALGMRHPTTPKYPCKCLIIKESIWSQDKSDEVRKWCKPDIQISFTRVNRN